MPSPRYRLRRGLFAAGAFLLAVLIALAFYVPITLLAPIPAVAAHTTSFSVPTTTAPRIPMPSYGASAITAIGYPGPLAQGGSRAPVPIASITKIVTSLVVLDKKPLAIGKAGPGILFTSADRAIMQSYQAQDGEVAPIAVGSTMSERDVLMVALIPSANNYARALADWAFGSEANFLPAANAWLKSHGMNSTVLADSTGLDRRTRSTPTDLIKLGQLALANPLVASIVSIRHAKLPVVGEIDNTNKLLGRSGISGIKTGTLLGVGASLLFTSRFQLGGKTITLIGAILDGPTHPIIDSRIRTMITAARSAFTDLRLVSVGHRFGAYSTAWRATTDAVGTKSVSVVILKGTPVTSTVRLDPIRVGAAGTVVGSARFTVGKTSYDVPIALTRGVRDPGAWWRLTHPGALSPGKAS